MREKIKIHHSDIPSKHLGSTSSIDGNSNKRRPKRSKYYNHSSLQQNLSNIVSKLSLKLKTILPTN